MREKYWYLKNSQLFRQLSPDVIQNLEARSRLRKFRSGEPVYLPIDAADGVLLLVTGQVKIYSLTPDGKQSILTFIEPGEIFGELAVYDGGERGDHAETTAKSEIVVIPAEAIRQLMAQSPELAVGITRLVGFRRRRIEQRLKYLLFHSNRQRLTHLPACLLFAAFSMFFSGGESTAGPMTCAQVMPLINDYQAGQLDAELAGNIEQHLAECAACRAHLQSISSACDSRKIARPPRLSKMLLASADLPRDRAWRVVPNAVSR